MPEGPGDRGPGGRELFYERTARPHGQSVTGAAGAGAVFAEAAPAPAGAWSVASVRDRIAGAQLLLSTGTASNTQAFESPYPPLLEALSRSVEGAPGGGPERYFNLPSRRPPLPLWRGEAYEWEVALPPAGWTLGMDPGPGADQAGRLTGPAEDRMAPRRDISEEDRMLERTVK